MKKTFAFFFIASLFCISILPGCKKIFDYLDDNPTADYTDCQIKEISFPKGLKATVTYNKDGNPISVIYPYTDYDHPNFIFRYDNKKRLIESIQYYDNGTAENWSRYLYDSHGVIIADTTVKGVVVENGIAIPDENAELRVHRYVYDAQKRIVNVKVFWPRESETEFVEEPYEYDSNGNRQPDGSSMAYDDKMNIHRTHKVFMFIDRNYSRNNLTGVTTYNSKYLPTQYGTIGETFLEKNLSTAAVTYKCK